ncbi:hypothetical protein Pmar_PMAR015015 [Perkinsus marinus ATCC 50983]|uniref:Uncharacterized protein n=1 Tax=Perkinsus marinus (strain ATCC 50983 / TXsc) TaxID=423536 RepID=C5KBH1_PERM5|nr:hypothetical protein Pmar_PMAR015015 [Perkinsus marinus ATCC 50983]EER18171.1 hypothetical protein Pmar_PMAR015015 [Perkinsus marinus ATCC 50983]|eukprot:XP_002786375.1 hypothetical protein Pmar_PMAR015015 [Perkinsus marinus ATCC 50983]
MNTVHVARIIRKRGDVDEDTNEIGDKRPRLEPPLRVPTNPLPPLQRPPYLDISIDGGAQSDSDDSLLPLRPLAAAGDPAGIRVVSSGCFDFAPQAGPHRPIGEDEQLTRGHEDFHLPHAMSDSVMQPCDDAGSVDCVHAARSSQRPLPELCLKLRVTRIGYLLCSSVCATLSTWGLETSSLCQISHTVKLGDGELRDVHQALEVPVVLRDLDNSPVIDDIVSVRVLESVTRQPFLLIGRDLIQAWDLRVFGASKVTTATGKLLFSSLPADQLALSTEFIYDVNSLLNVDDTFKETTCTTSVAVQPDPAVIAFETQLEPTIADELRLWLANLARRSKRQFGSAESGSYGIQLHFLPSNAPKDTTLQTHYSELSIPEPKSPTIVHRCVE